MRVAVLLATVFALAVGSTVPVWAETTHSEATRTDTAGGVASIGVTVTEMQSVVMKGWSAKHNVLGKAVYNEKNEKVGTVDDLILSPDMKAAYAVIGVGGFLKMGTHSVAVPTNQLKFAKDKILFEGANKDSLKNMPEFRFHKK